jgi:hypothetical protein
MEGREGGFQLPGSFAEVNQPQYLAQIKSPSGFAKAAGGELLLLDSIRCFHRASGMDGVAQIVSDLGRKADPRKLAKLAAAYENLSVHRQGFLLEHFGIRQAEALVRFAKKAKSHARLSIVKWRLTHDSDGPAALGADRSLAARAESQNETIGARKKHTVQ